MMNGSTLDVQAMHDIGVVIGLMIFIPLAILALGIALDALHHYVVEPMMERAERTTAALRALCKEPSAAEQGLCAHATECSVFRTRGCALTASR